MPHYPRLISMLRVAPHRLNVAGELNLTPTEAHLLRLCDFATATPGVWKLPPLPPDLVRAYALPSHLADGWAPPRPTPAAPSLAAPLIAPTISRYRGGPLPVRLRAWLANGATADQRRVLGSLCRGRDDLLAKRRLQQRLHRVPAARLNNALVRLVDAGLVARDRIWLILPAEVRDALRQAGLTVNRPAAARAQTGCGASGRKHARPRRRVCHEGRDGRLHVMVASLHGRRSLPPVGTSAWGRSMLAKRGGLARQRQCRALGINPTAEATARRLELRRTNQRHPR